MLIQVTAGDIHPNDKILSSKILVDGKPFLVELQSVMKYINLLKPETNRVELTSISGAVRVCKWNEKFTIDRNPSDRKITKRIELK